MLKIIFSHKNRNMCPHHNAKWLQECLNRKYQSSTKAFLFFFASSGPYRNRQKINIESNADFPTLGAAADQV